MVILYHIGGEQFSMILQVFLVLNGSKRWQFCVLINARANVLVTFLGLKNHTSPQEAFFSDTL